MKVVGLLSGGKDSVYNLLHCVINGHEPVCVASLGPPAQVDELDSYMYQTVGHSGLALLAQALDLPLFVHTITGTAVEQGAEYGSRTARGRGTIGDETEDLVALLTKVKAREAMPDVKGVACGAILSNYQRVRVEHVCSRLGLTPIAYLWERKQEDLLAEMVNAGMDSVLVKVAGAGLRVEHLGRSLSQMQPTLHALNAKYQLHVCGEGGEYETFTVDCPLFKKKVVLDKVTTVVSDSNPFATVAHWHIDECHLEDKTEHPLDETFDETRQRLISIVQTPALLDDTGLAISKAASKLVKNFDSLPAELRDIVESFAGQVISSSEIASPQSYRKGNWLSVSEVTADRNCASIEDEVDSCFQLLNAMLTEESADLLSIAHINIYLSSESMHLFPRINTVYSTYFGTSPPTRACVSVNLPANRRIKLDATAFVASADNVTRKALHVQSLSYWAPANIGPYSQCITLGYPGSRMFIAGQIPLEPKSLSLGTEAVPDGFARDVALSLQHVGRAKKAGTESRWLGECEGGVCWIGPVETREAWLERCVKADRGWRRFYAGASQPEEAWEEDHYEEGMSTSAGMVYVQAEELPRGASIEWQVTWATGVDLAVADDVDSDEDEGLVRTTSAAGSGGHQFETLEGGHVTIQRAPCNMGPSVVHVISCSRDLIAESSFKLNAAQHGGVVSVKAFHLPNISIQQVQEAAMAWLEGCDLKAFSTVCVRRISTIDADERVYSHGISFVVTVLAK
ncbi:hypothetical protein OIV83_004715 [Microbotryomycetes sp. JL201]|nr:hypothetical protein OIV83_004715 [Microbotryomycetes sp. JL201]